MKAAELVPMDATGRRTVQMRIPSLGNRMSNTIHMSVQCVMPGELAEAIATRRRLCASSSRVSRAPIPLSRASRSRCDTGDFITTPGWTYHDHCNEATNRCIWLDGLDSRLVAIGKNLGNGLSSRSAAVMNAAGFSARTMATPALLDEERADTPPFRYSVGGDAERRWTR